MNIRIKKIYFLTLSLFAIKLLYAYIIYRYYGLSFGKDIIGWDELQWQDGSIFFFNHGLGVDSIKQSFGLDGSFNNAGWPYLVAILHKLLGLSYFNAILVRMILFFFAANSLYRLMMDKGHSKNFSVIAVFFLAFYYPFFKEDATYLRDDIITYLVIILLRLSAVKGFIRGVLAIPVFLFLAYILMMSRPFAFLVFLSLYLLYFKLMRPIHLFFLVPIFIFVTSTGMNLFVYSYNFVATFRLNIKSIAFLSLKYYVGPLPWQMIGVDSGYSPLWYVVTLSGIVISCALSVFYIEIFRNWKILFALFITAALPYIISNQELDAVGPRQFAMVGPFLFIIIYGGIFRRLSFR